MARVSIPVSLDAAETAKIRLVDWLDNAEAGELDSRELDSGLRMVVDLLEEQRSAVHRATER